MIARASILTFILLAFSEQSIAREDSALFSSRSSAYGFSYHQVSGGWGISYRLNGEFYQHLALERTFYRTNCTHRSFKGFGVNATFFGNGNYSFGAKYYEVIRRFSSHMLSPYFGITPSWFTFEGVSGFNAKPIVGFKFSPLYGDAVSVDLDVYYGYDIPIIHERDFAAGRHDISALLSITFNINRICYLMSRSEVEKEISID